MTKTAPPLPAPPAPAPLTPAPPGPARPAAGPASAAQPLAEERLRLILALLAERGAARTTEIGARLGISGSTVRRDLEELSARGLVRKVHGGATLSSPESNEDLGYGERAQQQRGGKARLARLALSLIRPGQTVYLDAGSTALEVALALREQPALTRTLRVVTHAVNVAYELNGECALYVVGGENYGSTYSLVGPDTLAAVARHRYDLFLVGCTTIDPQRGPTNSNLIEAQLKAAIMEQSARRALIADASKWGQPGFAVFAPFPALSAWVTDRVPDGAAAVCAGAGLEVLSADAAAGEPAAGRAEEAGRGD